MSLSLIELYSHPPVNRISEFGDFAKQLDVAEVIKKYRALVQCAPHRHETGKRYFVESHDWFIGHKNSNRKEEHLAGAIFNACKSGETVKLPDGRKLDIIDYQFPLKTRQGDKGIGKVDLFGVIDSHIPCVIELKVAGKKGRKPDTPLRAFLEGLAYCAIVESNMSAITHEAKTNFGLKFKKPRPHLMVLAPENYWDYYVGKKAAGDWAQALKNIINEVSQQLKIQIQFLSIENAEFDWGEGQL